MRAIRSIGKGGNDSSQCSKKFKFYLVHRRIIIQTGDRTSEPRNIIQFSLVFIVSMFKQIVRDASLLSFVWHSKEVSSLYAERDIRLDILCARDGT